MLLIGTGSSSSIFCGCNILFYLIGDSIYHESDVIAAGHFDAVSPNNGSTPLAADAVSLNPKLFISVLSSC